MAHLIRHTARIWFVNREQVVSGDDPPHGVSLIADRRPSLTVLYSAGHLTVPYTAVASREAYSGCTGKQDCTLTLADHRAVSPRCHKVLFTVAHHSPT